MTIQYNSNYNETLPFSDICYQINCAAGVEETAVIHGSSTTLYQAYFEYTNTSNVFVRLNGTPSSPPAGSVTTQSYSEFKPKKRYVKGGDVIHFITPDATAYIGVSLRQLQG